MLLPLVKGRLGGVGAGAGWLVPFADYVLRTTCKV